MSCDFVQEGNEQHTRSSCNSVVIHRGAQTRRGLQEGDTSLAAQPMETGETPMSPQSQEPQTRHRSDSRLRGVAKRPSRSDTLSPLRLHTGEPDTRPGSVCVPKKRKRRVRCVPAPEGRAARRALLRLVGGSAAALSAKSFDFHESECVTQKHPARRERRMNSRH